MVSINILNVKLGCVQIGYPFKNPRIRRLLSIVCNEAACHHCIMEGMFVIDHRKETSAQHTAAHNDCGDY